MTDATCLFCAVPTDRILTANRHAFAMRDGFPVTTGHTLVIPQRHVRDYFALTPEEVLACDALLRVVRDAIAVEDPSVSGFNIGMNCGAAAGQTIFHCHIHLIPRRTGDVANPRGGVRGVIPGRMGY